MIDSIRQSGLFDEAFYRGQAPNISGDPIEHYLTTGAALNLDPHPLFSTEWYWVANQDIANGPQNQLEHFVRRGAKEGRPPHPLFDLGYYLRFHPAYTEAWANPLVYYLAQGASPYPDPHPLFDTKFYLASNPEVKARNLNPLLHYMTIGWREGRDPHPLFHTRWYLEKYPDVAASGMNPLVHWTWYGANELRDPNPLFDVSFYKDRSPDLAGMNPLAHYVLTGAAAGADPHPLFDSAYYLTHNPDVASIRANPLEHFFSIGAREGRDPHPFFKIYFYRENAGSILSDDANPLVHYLEIGAALGLDPDPRFDTSFYQASNSTNINPLVAYVLSGRATGARTHPDFPAGASSDAIDFTAPDANDVLRLRGALSAIGQLSRRPLISILLPTWNTPPKLLTRAVESVLKQIYENWELCISDDGSTNPETLSFLAALAERDPRVSIIRNTMNRGISRATNDALAIARGEFVAMLDHDDELTCDALAEVVLRLDQDPLLDVVYTDQDYINEDGTFGGNFFKPDWSPHFFCGVMYIGHLLVVRRSLAVETGGFDPAFDYVQDFEFMLRLSEKTSRIAHVPVALYSWRRIPGSVAAGTEEKSGIPDLQAAAVNRHFQRTGFPAIAMPNPALAHRQLIRPSPARSLPSLTVIHPRQLTGLPADVGDFLIVKRDGLETLSPDWIESLLLYAELQDVGCVSALILDPLEKVESAGLIVDRNAELIRAMKGIDRGSDGYAGSLAAAREVSAVPDDCLMIETRKLRSFGIRAEFRTSFYQVADLSLRMASSGLRNIHNPRAVMKASDRNHAILDDRLDRELFREIWREQFRGGDPFHNRNFLSANFGWAS